MSTKMHLIINCLLIILISLKLVSNDSQESEELNSIHEKPNDIQRQQTIAVIGCGVGGSSSAYFLNNLAKSDEMIDISIDLFERSAEIGGRLATQVINGKHYETGGSVIHDRNQWAQRLTKLLNIPKRQTSGISEQKVCLYNGKSFDFCESHWTLWTYFKVWLRYGFNVNKMQSKVHQIMDDFEKVYKLQEYSVPFQTVDELLHAMNPEFNNLTKTSYKDYLFGLGFSKKFIEEFVQSIALVNYGQDLSIHAFVGCVSFAGAGAQLWSIKGGNKVLPKRLAQYSNANIYLTSRVESVTYLAPNLFELTVSDTSGNTYTKRYNSVIIATPLTENQIIFNNFSVNLIPSLPKRKYHRTVSTLVAGKLNQKFRGRDVLTDNKSNFFTSIGRVYPVDGSTDERTPVYKVFSQTPLTTEEFNKIFDEIQVIKINDWFAYPEYDSSLQPLPPFILHPGLYHVNAIEWAASAIEMSLIGGKNAALLVYNHLRGKTSNVYTEYVPKKSISDEL